MESKKKKKIVIIISIIAVCIIVAVSLFFVFKNVKDKKQNSNPATNVSLTTNEQKRKEAEKAIIRKETPYNYNGNYQFSHVGNITFNENLSSEQIKTILKSHGVSDLNSFINKMNEHELAKKESLVLNANTSQNGEGGRFTLSQNSPSKKINEYGIYYGNDDLSEIYIYNEKTKKHESKYRMSLTCPEDIIIPIGSINSDNSKYVYIFKNYYNGNGDVLMTETLVYERLPDKTNIIDDIDLKL